MLSTQEQQAFTTSKMAISPAASPFPTRSARQGWTTHPLDLLLYVTAFFFSPLAVWKFPVLLSNFGGVAFLLPFLMCVLSISLPVLYLEISLGQFMQRAGPQAWGVVPLLKGLGITSMLACLLKITLNLILTAWSAYYLYLTIVGALPVCTTDQTSEPALAGVPVIADRLLHNRTMDVVPNITRYYSRGPTRALLMRQGADDLVQLSDDKVSLETDLGDTENKTCLEQFSSLWRDEVLQSSQEVTSIGVAVIHNFVAVLAVTVIYSLVVIKGIGWSGKIMYVMAPLPVLGLLSVMTWAALNGRALHTGAARVLSPNFESLTNIQTWVMASCLSVRMFGIGLGVFPVLASYNKLNRNIKVSTSAICVLCVVIHVFASVCVYSLIGREDAATHQANQADTDPSFLFKTLLASLSTLRHGTLITLTTLAILVIVFTSTSAVLIESVVSSLVDLSPKLRPWRLLIMIGTLAGCFLLSIPMTMQGGIYIFYLFDRVFDQCLVVGLVCVLQCLAIAYLYGGSRFYDNLEMILGEQPHWWMKFCWGLTAPVILTATVAYSAYDYPAPPVRLGITHPYFGLAQVLMVVMVVVMLLPVVVVAVWVVCGQNGGCVRKMRQALQPNLNPSQVPIRWKLEGLWRRTSNL